MNGVIFSISEVKNDLDPAFKKLMSFATTAGALYDWGILHTRELFESVARWAALERIPLFEWEKKFDSSIESSLEDIARYYGFSTPKEFRKKFRKVAKEG